MKFFALLVSAFLLVPTVCGAREMSRGEYFFRNAENCFHGKNGFSRDIDRAVKLYHLAAENGSSQAQIALSRLHYHGTGVRKDFSKAFFWAKKAAETNPFGALLLGWMYLHGKGCEKNPQAGFNAFMKAAHARIPSAYAHVAWCYFYGTGAEFDVRKALEFYQKAAACGDRSGMWVVAGCLKYGQFLPENNAAAEALYLKCLSRFTDAARAGDYEALCQIGMIYRFGLTGKYDIVKCREIWRNAAGGGSRLAKHFYANMLLYGEGGEKNVAEAVRILKEIADTYPKAKRLLVSLFDNGIHVARDRKYAEKLFREIMAKEAEFADDYPMLLLLGRAFESGIGCEVDTARSEKYYQKAFEIIRQRADAGIFQEMLVMGYCCYFGIGCKVDRVQAKKYLLPCKKLIQNHAECEEQSGFVLYGIMHQHGWGVEKSAKTAAELFHRAYKIGSPEGAYLLYKLCAAGQLGHEYKSRAKEYLEYAERSKFAPALKEFDGCTGE